MADVTQPRVVKLAPEDTRLESYRMTRPIKFDGVLFKKGEAVRFTDDHTQTLFIKNNYVV